MCWEGEVLRAAAAARFSTTAAATAAVHHLTPRGPPICRKPMLSPTASITSWTRRSLAALTAASAAAVPSPPGPTWVRWAATICSKTGALRPSACRNATISGASSVSPSALVVGGCRNKATAGTRRRGCGGGRVRMFLLPKPVITVHRGMWSAPLTVHSSSTCMGGVSCAEASYLVRSTKM